MHRRLPITIALATTLLAGCERLPLETAGATLEGPPLETGASTYTLASSDQLLMGEIDFRFTNRSERTISLLNCLGGWALALEKQVGGEWVRAWSGVRLGCLSPPIEIGAGEAREDTLRVFAGQRGTNTYPQFAVEEIEGTYRLVLGDAFWNYDHDGPPWGTTVPLEFRVSAPFQIRVE